MVKINRIYTRTGDTGETGLVGGTRVPKDSLRVAAYGDVDELNSFLGWARTLTESSAPSPAATIAATRLALLQNELFDLGSELATPAGSNATTALAQPQIDRLEKWIDEATENLPELRSFVLPGGSELNSVLHVARCVCRRAERSALTLSRTETVSPVALVYLNRLSDYLFALSRFVLAETKTPEYLWCPGKTGKSRDA